MPDMEQSEKVGLQWPAELRLAEHVVVGYHDIAGAGLRALLLFKDALAAECSSQSGPIFSSGEEGEVIKSAVAWGFNNTDSSGGLQVDTFHKDGKAILSFVCLNMQMEPHDTSVFAYQLVHELIRSKVTQVQILAGLHFNPSSGNSGKLHIITPSQPSGSVEQNSAENRISWNASWPIEDGFLAAMLQMLKLEKEMMSSVVVALGHRLPRETCLNLPKKVDDPTTSAVLQLCEYLNGIIEKEGLQCKPESSLQTRAAVEMRLKPLVPLTKGEFAPAEPDSFASLYK